MGSLFPSLARALVPALAGGYQGQAEGQIEARKRADLSQAALMRQWAFQREQTMAAQADQDRQRTQALSNAAGALKGIHLGMAPTTADIPVPGVGGAVRLPSRYEQIGTGPSAAYIDRTGTPQAQEYQKAQEAERRQAALVTQKDAVEEAKRAHYTRAALRVLQKINPQKYGAFTDGDVGAMDSSVLSDLVKNETAPAAKGPGGFASVGDWIRAHQAIQRPSNPGVDKRENERTYRAAEGAYDKMLSRRPKAKDFADPLTLKPDTAALSGAMTNWRADSTAKAGNLDAARTALAGAPAAPTGAPAAGAPTVDKAAMQREFDAATAQYRALLANPRVPKDQAQAAYNADVIAITKKYGATP